MALTTDPIGKNSAVGIGLSTDPKDSISARQEGINKAFLEWQINNLIESYDLEPNASLDEVITALSKSYAASIREAYGLSDNVPDREVYEEVKRQVATRPDSDYAEIRQLLNLPKPSDEQKRGIATRFANAIPTLPKNLIYDEIAEAEKAFFELLPTKHEMSGLPPDATEMEKLEVQRALREHSNCCGGCCSV